MMAMAVGLVLGLGMGLAYLFSKDAVVRRTLASSVLLGVFVGVLVELARRPLLAVLFAVAATIFLAEFIRWVRGGSRKRS